MWKGSKTMFKFSFGNLHSLVANPKKANSDSKMVNSHRWVMFVALTKDKEATGKFIDHLQSNIKEKIKLVICLDALTNSASTSKDLYLIPNQLAEGDTVAA